MRLRMMAALLAGALMIIFAGIDAEAAGAPESPVPVAFAQVSTDDHDGDGLTNDLDLDDDNDGLPDQSDPSPFDALIPGTAGPPPPGPNAPDQDSDGDEIPNDIDPDDDNNGIPDSGTAPVTIPPPVPSQSGSNGAGGNSASPSTQNLQAPPLVTALPSTGSGHDDTSVGMYALGLLSIATLRAAFGSLKVSGRR